LHLVAIVNGPGEVAGWMLPLVERLKARSPESRVTAVLTPCQYASGRERDVVAASPAVDDVLTFGGFVRQAWRNRRSLGAERQPPTVVFHFGGDPFYAGMAAAMLRAPAWRYGTTCKGLMRTDRYLVPDDRTRAKLVRQGVDPGHIDVVGQLVIDSVPPAAMIAGRETSSPDREARVVLMPGSRRFELAFMLPFYGRVLDALRARCPRAAFTMPIAPFVSRALFFDIAASARYAVEAADEGLRLVTPGGTPCRLAEGDPFDVLRWGDVAVTLPGTNTLQLAALGVPYVVLLPLNRGENIPLEGLAGWVLPSLRPFGLVRRRVTWWINRRIDYVALPNILADEAVVPELRGVLEPEAVADAVAALLADPARRAAMSARLRRIAGPPGAADRAVTVLLEAQGNPCRSGS